MTPVMQDVGASMLCRLPPPPELLVAPRHAARTPACRQSLSHIFSFAGFSQANRRWDRIATGCQSSQQAEPADGMPNPPASGSITPDNTAAAAEQPTAPEERQPADMKELMKLVALLPAAMQKNLRSHPDFLQVCCQQCREVSVQETAVGWQLILSSWS